MRFQKGQKPWNWRGVPIIEPRGYVLVHVGKDHPLADCRGYAYQHRLVAQERLDRPLTFDDVVHHDDEQNGSNAPDNLIITSRAWHRVLHRKSGKKLRLPGQENTVIACACGCGATFLKFDEAGRPRRFITGHNFHRPRPATEAVLNVLRTTPAPLSLAQLCAATGKARSPLKTMLWRLKAEGAARRTSHGMWAAAQEGGGQVYRRTHDEYPNRE